MNVLVFDIETVPDVEAGARLYRLEGLDDASVAEVMFHEQRQRSGTDFLRHHLHRIVSIAVALRRGDRFQVWSLGEPESGERELIERFFDGVERYTPTLVSWNGGGFDLPVLHYRAMRHGLSAARYWETGEDDTAFRYNNYLNRFHQRHTDLMDVLAGYQARASVALDSLATVLGMPGKLGMDGSKVWDCFREGRIDAIRNYCETDVLNTYLVFLRYELMRGRLDDGAHARECALVRRTLAAAERPHFDEFLAAWRADGEDPGAAE